MARYDDDHDYTRLGSIYHNMKTRCTNPNYDKYKWYGGKGISICDEWMNSYDIFEEWALSHGYADDLTLDRIDPDGDYTPENCRWISRKEQANNRTSNHLITYNGKTQTIQQWSEELGILRSRIDRRLEAGWPIERIFTEPPHVEFHKKTLTYNGETLPMIEWSRRLGFKPTVIGNRLARGWSVERAIETPVGERGWHYDPERNYCHG